MRNIAVHTVSSSVAESAMCSISGFADGVDGVFVVVVILCYGGTGFVFFFCTATNACAIIIGAAGFKSPRVAFRSIISVAMEEEIASRVGSLSFGKAVVGYSHMFVYLAV